MKKTRKTFVGILTPLLITSITTVSTALVTANAPVDGDGTALESIVNDENANSKDALSTYDAYPSAPTVIWDNTQYNMVVRYDWRVGKGGDDLAMSKNWQNYYRIGDVFYRTYEFPENTGTDHCDPEYFLAKSYDSPSKTYSLSYASLEHDVDMGDYTLVRYGYESKYSAVGMFKRWAVSSDDIIPNSYDKEYYIWNHNSSTGHKIKGTINYQGILADIEVNIPWIGYATSSVVISGKTFYLRTGPYRCSIKTDSSNLRVNDLHFAFGIE